MLSGLITSVEEIEYQIFSTKKTGGTGTGDATGATHGATLTQTYQYDYDVAPQFFKITGSSAENTLAPDFRSYTLEFGGTTYTHTISGAGDIEARFRCLDPVLYVTLGGSWDIRFSGFEWEVEGSIIQTFGSSSITGVLAINPATVPGVGNPPLVSAGCGVLKTDTLYLCQTPISEPPGWVDTVGSITAEGGGGYRLKIGGVYEAFPVQFHGSSGITGTDTWETKFTSSFAVNNVFGQDQNNSDSNIWAVAPNLPRSVELIDAGYESLPFRGGLPGFDLLHEEQTVVTSCPAGTSTTSASDSASVHPAQTQFLQPVQTGTETITNPFTNGITCPFFRLQTGYLQNWTNQIDSEEKWRIGFGAETNLTNALSHYRHNTDWLTRFTNTWLNPHWSFFLWFPQDSASSSVRWDLLGADSDIEYWYNIRQQHITHPALPSGEDSRRRVNVTTEPINQNAIVGVPMAITTLPCWWGITGFTIETESFPTEFTTNSTSAARFAFWNGATPGTGSVGSTITINSGSDAVEFELASFTDYPYMTTMLADRLKVVWTDTNIATVKVFAIGADGTSVQIGPTAGVVSDTVYRIPFGDSEKWATSAAGDFGAGYLTDDYTPDAGVSADDISAATLSDAERISSFGLLPGFSPVKIRIEITRAGSYTGNVTLQHLTFYMAPWADAKVFHESGLVSTILFKNGPMVRYGALGFFDYLLDTPLSVPVPISDVVNKTTIGDLWCWENVFLRGESALTDLLTRMGAEFVVGEEFPAGVTEHLWRYSDGVTSFIDSVSGVVNSSIGPRLWYLNTFRCVPPLALFPTKKRASSDGWLLSGQYGQYAYSDISNKHPHIVPGDLQPQLFRSGSDHLTLQAAPEGWQVGVFLEAVDNNEAQDWELRWNGQTWFKMRPWRGSASIFGLPVVTPEGNVSIDVDISNTLTVRTIVSDNLLQYQYTDTNRVWQTVDTGKECKWARVDIDDASRDRTIYIVIQTLTDEVELYRCTTFGATLTLVRNYGAGKFPSIMIAPDGVRQLVWIESGAVKSVIEDAEDNIIEAEFTAYAAADDLGLDIAYDRKGTGSKGAILTLVEGGDVKAFDSSDGGKTFS